MTRNVKLRLFFLFIVWPSFLFNCALCQEANLVAALNLHQWGALSSFHGLPSDQVRAVAQDKNGFLWFGTDAGLTKYDGRRIGKIAVEKSPFENIRCLRFDAQGALWIGANSGAFRLTGDRITPISQTAGYPINAIRHTTEGKTFLASERGALFCVEGDAVERMDGETFPGLWIDAARKTPLPLTGVAQVGDSLLVSSRGRGILALERGSLNELSGTSRMFFSTGVEVDRNQRIWFGGETSPNGCGIFSGETTRLLRKLTGDTGTVTALTEDGDGGMWIGTSERGAFYYRNGKPVERLTFESTAGGLRSNRIHAIFIDREEVVWFGTDRGACRFDPNSPNVIPISENPEENVVRSALVAADGTVWCGVNRGLFYRRKSDPSWRRVNAIGERTVYAIAQTPSNTLLIGTSSGLFVSDKLEREFRRIPHAVSEESDANIRSIARFRGAYYLGVFGEGLHRFDGVRYTAISSSAPFSKNVVSLFAEADDRLWVGSSDAGVWVYDGEACRRDSTCAALDTAAVRGVYGGRKTGLWFASNRGLFFLRNGRLASGLENCDVRWVAPGPSEESVWCGTVGNGAQLCRIDDAERIRSNPLDMGRGLPSNTVFCIAAADRTPHVFWIGTGRSVARYKSGATPPTLMPVRVFGDREHPISALRDAINLEYPQNGVLVDVVALSARTFPEQFHYEFSLCDQRSVVVSREESPQGQFSVQGLRPGAYELRAVAYGNDLLASQPLVIRLIVGSPPFPKVTVALACLLSIALCALSWGYWQNRRLARINFAFAEANRQLAATRLQLVNETENERRRIARDLHDQTLSDLRRLQLMTDELSPPKTIAAGAPPHPLRNEIEAVSTEIRRICEDLSPSLLTNVGLGAALQFVFLHTNAQLPENERFQASFTCPDWLDERLNLDESQCIHIYRIVQEALNNVRRHASAKTVSLSVWLERDWLFVCVEDDGKGFEEKEKVALEGRGIANIRARASLIQGFAEWTSSADGGVRFTFSKRIEGLARGVGQ